MQNTILTREEMVQFGRDGFYVARGLFSSGEMAQWREHFMAIHARGPVEGYFSPVPKEKADGEMLRMYPRMLMPHRWDEAAKSFMLDNRIAPILHDLLGEEPLAAQSMFYFKPPGARGQALHQDDFYLLTQPEHCMAAWLAVDDTDSQNGGLSVVPGSHRIEVLCPHAADLKKSFTIEEVDIPPGMEAVQVELKAGDVLFFNGSVIHGSEPNRTKDRFRRSFICHYVPRSTTAMQEGYTPLLSFDGEPIEIGKLKGGGPCGTEDLRLLHDALMAQGELAQVALDQNAVAVPD
jgi:hypothetical protein